MRILWWSALALLLCLAVTSALRTQTDVTPRVSRRFPNSNRNPINANKTEDVAPTSRAQFSRRREVTTIRSKPTDNVSRTRSRSKVTETSSSLTNPSEVQTERTEQFDSRKSNNRIRNRRPVIDEANFDTTLSREKVKSRSRQTSRYSTPQTVQPAQSLPTSSLVETSTRTPIEITSYDDSSKGIKEVTSQFKRRSSTIRTVETTSASRVRGRINTRSDIKPLDLEVSGTANALTSAPRDPTTVRNGEIRNSRKLKYRTRQTETDTNLTGEGIASNERKFNETRQPIYNQSVFKKISRSSTENIVEQYTEKSIGRTAKVIKRPVSRRKVKSTIKAEKSKPSEEVSEDDNYPESFKALIQAKNASTHTSSPSSESLSVKESQKVFQTLTTTPQSFLTTPDVEKHTLLRNKLNAEDDKNDTQNDTLAIVETVATTTEESIVKPAEYRLRGTYTPRIKTLTTSSAPGIQTSTLTPSTQRSYKFSRKAKSITTQTPLIESSPKTKRLETNLYYKKPVRSSFYPKRNSTRNSNVNPDIPKITVTERSNNIKTSINYKSRQILPRTSYYSRLRSSTANVVTITEPSAKDVNEVFFADKKMENTVEVPLIYTSFNSPFNTSVSVNSLHRQDDTNISQTPFIIQVNSKESSENGTDNEIISKIEETETERSTIFATTTQKYHATYKDNNKVYVNENKENGVSTLQPPIRNIQTRKFSRKPTKQREEYSIVTQKYRDRNLRKYSDTFSKTTEASSNGIIAESDKPKSKFSSKYRASYLDKPFYKPTVPTITTSTVEGEEIQLGVDMNAISFTKTRSPLTSADLKLSESLVKPLQVMNVEASHHSPSVTVSIFDALAEILTSTPRPRISSTTEVQQNQNFNSDVKQTIDAVSNNINVNNVKDLTSQDTLISKDNVNTVAQSVQITEQTTPVFNRMPVGETITPSLNIEDKKTISQTTSQTFPFTTPLPLPTTPLSARRPFAIKVLYAETEPPSDITTSVSTLNAAMTDNPKMVHNTVSDLILSNNKLVSSQLTSMLSNNIKNIIQNMDDGSKGRLSVEMVKLLNSLIPKLQKSMTSEIDVDSFPNTTPYSLEDIKDTENIVLDGNEVLSISSTNILQNVDNDTIVNSTLGNVLVNNPSANEEFGSTTSMLGDLTILTSNEQSTEAINFQNPTIETTTIPTSIFESLTNAPSVDVFINNDNRLNLNGKEFTNNNTLLPFLTNFELNDFTAIANMTDSNNSPTSLSNLSEITLNTTSVPNSSLQIRELENIDKIEDPSQLSRLQLWILSKKARVLKMIEELIRNHNDEIANAPLTELISNSEENNLSFSNRLSEIVNTMTSTTSNSDITNENIMTSTVMTNIPETTTFTPQTPLPIQSTTTFITTGRSESMSDFLTTTERSFDDANFGEIEQSTTSASNLDTNILSTTSATNEVSTTLQVQETDTSTVNFIDVTTSNSLEETTIDANLAIESSITTVKNLDTTTVGGTETSSSSQINNVNNTSNELNIATTASIPKKDYVIFGILPNNTVTKQIRTEKPDDVNGNAIFKFIPIDQVTVSDLESNVLKLGSTKMPITLTTDIQTSTIPSIAESSTQSQVRNSMTNEDLTSTVQTTTDMFSEPNKSTTTEPVSSITESILLPSITTPVQIQITTEQVEVVTSTTTNPITATNDPVTLSNIAPISTTQAITSTQVSNNSPFTVTTPLTKHNLETASSNQNEAELLQSLLREIGRTPKNLNGLKFSDRLTEVSPKNNNDQLLQSILAGGALNSKTLMNKAQTTTSRSIEDEIRQFEEDTKLLKALLQATGRNPAELNLPSLDEIKKVAASGTTVPVTTIPPSTTMITTTVTPTTTFRTTTTTRSTTTNRPVTTIQSTTMSINEDIRKLQEDTKLLQALLQATRNKNTVNLPVISGITSNVRIASNPFTTSLESNPTTPVNLRPVYTTRPLPIITTLMPGTVTVSTLQPQQQSGDDFGISTTFQPFNERSTTTIRSIGDRSTTSRNPKSITTEMPSTSTFSDEEDLIFLQNLKSVLSTKTGDGDPETALANRVIALAVEKSLNEIQTGKVTTTNRPTTTTRTTTTTRRITTTVPPNTPSIEDDIKQFEQDTKLLQALLKATGQDPSKLNIPTLPPTNKPVVGIDSSKSGNPTTVKPYGVKIAVKDELKNEQDDAKLLQTLIKLQDAQETTTQRSKIALTGQSSDEALKKLLQQAQPTGMLSEATKSSVSLSTEYGNSNDALLAALLKEQGFGPTTASSLDEQLRLAALLNQVVVTPKARRPTTRPPPPPPPAPRRPVLDGLAWLWQQWRETGPGPGGARPNRRPAPSERPSPSSGETSSRVNWFGSGPFVGNADEKPSSNRVGFASLLLKLCDWG